MHLRVRYATSTENRPDGCSGPSRFRRNEQPSLNKFTGLLEVNITVSHARDFVVAIDTTDQPVTPLSRTPTQTALMIVVAANRQVTA